MARRETEPVDGTIFWSSSRLAGDQIDSQFIKADLRRRGHVVHSMTDDIPSGEFAPVAEALIDWKNERFLKGLSSVQARFQQNRQITIVTTPRMWYNGIN